MNFKPTVQEVCVGLDNLVENNFKSGSLENCIDIEFTKMVDDNIA